MNRWAVTALILTALLLGPLSAAPASAAEVNQTLIALNIAWHVGSETSSNTQITVNVGDTLHLTIDNQETSAGPHTFTAPHFAAAPGQIGGGSTLNISLAQGADFVWNHTFTSADLGTWQYYCEVLGHSSGTYPDRTGMVGTIRVTQPAPPPTPGFEVLLVVAALGIVAVAVRVLPRRRK
jgi:plastocyanin